MTPAGRGPRAPVDDFVPAHPTLGEAILSRRDSADVFLVSYDELLGRREWTVTEWKAEILSAAGRLTSAGLRRGDRLALLSRNDAESLAITFACWILGVEVAPLDAGHGAAGLAAAIHALRPAAVAASGPAERLLPEIGVADVPRIAVSAQAAADVRGGASGADLPLLCLQSSGTSGRSKAVLLSQQNLVVNADAMQRAFGWNSGERVLTVLPICHGNGLLIGSLMPWLCGAAMVLGDRFRADAFWRIAADEGATTASIVPTVMAALLDGEDAAPPEFRDVISGSGPLAVATATQFAQRFVGVRQLYGLSETTAVLTITPRAGSTDRAFDVAPGTTAGPVIPHVEMAVLDPSGHPCPPGVHGELAARGAMIMSRYEGMPAETEDALRDGWFHTGDRGAWLPGPDGTPWYTVTGRLKEIIVRGGLNVSPLEIDDVLAEHPAVREALAFGYPDPRYGEEIAAFVVAASPVTEAELLAHCAAHLQHGHRPRRILFGSDIPRTHTGKARRQALAARLTPKLSPA